MSNTKQRLTALVQLFAKHEIDALLVTDQTNVRYLSGFTGDSSYLLVMPQRTTILSDGRFTTQIKIDCPDLQCAIRPPSQTISDLAQSLLNDSGISRVGIESTDLALATFRELESACASIELVETTGVVESIRMIKDAEEITKTRQAVQIAEESIEAVIRSMVGSDSERDIAYRIEAEMRSRGAEGCSFPAIVACGAAGALPHYHPGATVVGDAATLLIDWGASYQGYASDLTRTFHRPPASDDFRVAYEAVLAAQLAAIDLIAPGVIASDVDAAAREVLERAGMADAFMHSLGHGTGLDIHEGPRLAASSDQTLASGMIITVEPGVYFRDRFGIRIEDDVLVTDSGYEVLSRLPKGLEECRLML